MASIAILIGNANYKHQDSLDCCARDVEAMKALLQATERFDRIEALTNLDADGMRNVVRDVLPTDDRCDEIFFYFSGHGDQQAADFYYCGTGYDPKSPNLTGVSHSDLNDLFRAAKPTTLVTVIDACFSGALLIKRDRLSLPPVLKEGFRNVLQFSSSMDSQTSMGGDPLSAFTRAFLEASVRQTEGPVYYVDIANALRDIFIDNDDQTPFFVSQGTGREILVENANQLAEFKRQLVRDFRPPENDDDDDENEDSAGGEGEGSSIVIAPPHTPKDLLEAAEARMGSPDQARELIDWLFDGLVESFDETEFAEFFDKDVVHHSNYLEPTIEDFMIRVLAREDRPDRLVTAEVKRQRRKPTALEAMQSSLIYSISHLNNDFVESYDLNLNCTLDKAQLRLTLTPKFRSLQRLVLVLSCAPSLDTLYVFEMVTCHLRTDWDTFAKEGNEAVRRWYKLEWNADPDWLVRKVCDALSETVRKHIEQSVGGLSDD